MWTLETELNWSWPWWCMLVSSPVDSPLFVCPCNMLLCLLVLGLCIREIEGLVSDPRPFFKKVKKKNSKTVNQPPWAFLHQPSQWGCYSLWSLRVLNPVHWVSTLRLWLGPEGACKDTERNTEVRENTSWFSTLGTRAVCVKTYIWQASWQTGLQLCPSDRATPKPLLLSGHVPWNFQCRSSLNVSLPQCLV